MRSANAGSTAGAEYDSLGAKSPRSKNLATKETVDVSAEGRMTASRTNASVWAAQLTFAARCSTSRVHPSSAKNSRKSAGMVAHVRTGGALASRSVVTLAL